MSYQWSNSVEAKYSALCKIPFRFSDFEVNEDFDYHKIPPTEEPDIEDEVQLNEELQVILPPRYDEIAPGPSVTTTITSASCSFH